MKKKIIALFLTGVMLVGTSVQAQAGRIVKPIDEQLAERKVITTPQERKIRLGEDEKPRVIITSDLEVDDMNSFIHQSLFLMKLIWLESWCPDLFATLPETASIPRER